MPDDPEQIPIEEEHIKIYDVEMVKSKQKIIPKYYDDDGEYYVFDVSLDSSSSKDIAS